MPDFHEAIGEDVLEEPAEKLHDVEVDGAEAGTAHVAGGEGDRAAREGDHAIVGDSDLKDRRGEGGEGGVALVVRLTVDIPGDGPDLRLAVLQHTSVAHLFLEEGTGDGGEGFHRDKEVGAGGPPGRAVLGEATTGHNVMDVRVVLQLLFGDAVGGCVVALGQQADFSDRGCLRPFAFTAEVESRDHLLTQWAHVVSPFVRRVVDVRRKTSETDWGRQRGLRTAASAAYLNQGLERTPGRGGVGVCVSSLRPGAAQP